MKYDVSNSRSIRPIAGLFVFLLSLFATLQLSYASEALVQKYQKLAELSGISFTYGNLETLSNDAFTLHDITLIREGVEDPIKIKSITLKGVVELNGDGLSAENISMTGLSWDGRGERGEEVVVSVSDGSMDGFYLPDAADTDAPVFIFDQYSAQINNISVLVDGNKVLELPAIISEFASVNSGKTFDGYLKMAGMKFFPENMKNNQKFMQQMNALGYEDIQLDINIVANWDLDSGVMALTKYEFDVLNMGALDIQVSLGGYTEEFTKKMRTTNAQIQALPSVERAKASSKIMQQMGELTLQSLKVSFRDNSITNKIIDMQANAAGQPSENMKAMLPIMLNGMMAKLEKPALSATLVSAVEAFLAQPGIISVTAAPAAPITFTEMFGLAVSVPGMLIDKLNLSANAN